MQRIVIVGGGFAGLWSAVGAARKLDELGIAPAEVEVVLVNPTKYHSIRVRNYEKNLDETLVPLADVLDPIGVRWIEGTATDINYEKKTIALLVDNEPTTLQYDRLVLALGSQLASPPIPGLAEHAFNIDTYPEALRLQQHLAGLPGSPGNAGRWTALVIGAGLTGIEIAAELPARLRDIAGKAGAPLNGEQIRVMLADRGPQIGRTMGEAQPVIERALRELGVELLTDFTFTAVDPAGVTLADGGRMEAATVIWCGGMRAHPLAGHLPVALDEQGRVPADQYLRVIGLPSVFAAGDVARVLVDGQRPSVMSCQHSRPMGRFAGHNVVSDLLGLEMLPLTIDWYTTILDLADWGAVYTEGWERKLAAQGSIAKATKAIINGDRIYPPRTRVREAILKTAEPVIQAPPPLRPGDAEENEHRTGSE